MPNIYASEPAFVSAANAKVVSTIVKNTGFQSAQQSTLHALADLFGDYLERLFSTTHKYAEIGGRTRPNYHDITRSLEEGGILLSHFERYLENDYTQARHVDFIRTELDKNSTEEKATDFLPSDDEEDDPMERGGAPSSSTLPPYVPKHLPHFPSKHSFRQTPVYIQRPDDPQKVRELNSQQSRTVEENLKKLMAAENQLSRQDASSSGPPGTANVSSMMTIVNYQTALQRRNRKRTSGLSDFKANTQTGFADEAKAQLPEKSRSPMQVDTTEEIQTSDVQ